ncbi:MAG: MMPL family transporter [Trueperaceae bacterium]|nr:MMPL family transporter [Trueperaceae bacterium]
MTRIGRWWGPALVVVLWLVGMGIGGPYFGRLAEVQTQAQTDFLPSSAESTRALVLQRAFGDDAGPPAILLFEDPLGIAADVRDVLAERLERIAALDGTAGASPLIPSPAQGTTGDPIAYQSFVQVDGDAPEVVAAIRAELAALPAGVAAYVTGPAGFLADLVEAFGEIDGILLVVAVVAVFIILLFVYRSPFLPILVLLSSIAALSVSVVAVYLMAAAGWITLNGQAQGILFILVIGAATDYALLLVSRYREALLEERDPFVAMRRAWRGSVEPILASGGTVVAGVLCLLLSDLNSNKALGPIAAAGIVVAMLSALTFLPAVLTLVGRAAFFPFPPRLAVDGAAASAEGSGFWAGVAALVERRPRATWVVTTVVLLVAAAFAPSFQADGVPQSEIVLGTTESVVGQEIQARYFAAGSGAPTIVIAEADRAERMAEAVADVSGVSSVSLRTAPFGGPPASRPPLVAEVDGRSLVELQVTLAFASDSREALDLVGALREVVRGVDELAVVGGPTAADLDTRTTARADLLVIIPAVLVVISVMLMMLLRSVLAPLLLVATTALSYLSTLGVASLVFDRVLGFPGADPVVPLFAFVFLVALGIDYNIFLTSRIREEALLCGTRPAVLVGLRTTGGVITSAGVVLAATFAALAVIPLLFLVQLAFLVAFGVLLDALVVRSFLVPGLLYDLGPRSWWPSRPGRMEIEAPRASPGDAPRSRRHPTG